MGRSRLVIDKHENRPSDATCPFSRSAGIGLQQQRRCGGNEMATYLKDVMSRKRTAQSAPIPGSAQVPNSAGGFAWGVDDWTRLQRFLVLGAEGGSYYATQKALTLGNAQAVVRCLQADSVRTVRAIVDISESGRAPKPDP